MFLFESVAVAKLVVMLEPNPVHAAGLKLEGIPQRYLV
jgi:hypothetical protein